MSKNKGKKRVLKRKVKRTIRYTVAALFMVTAIIVAAIPVQTNRADDGSVSTQAEATDDRTTDYSYPVKDDRTVGSGTEPDSSSTGGTYYTTVPVGNNINLSLYHQNPQMSDVYKGYNVIRLSNGYYLNWQ